MMSRRRTIGTSNHWGITGCSLVSPENHLCELQLTTSLYMRAKATTGHGPLGDPRAEGGSRQRAARWTLLYPGATAPSSSLVRTQALHCWRRLRRRPRRHRREIVRAGADANAPANTGRLGVTCRDCLGHERVVWALLDVGGADHSVACDRGACALTLGFALLRSSKKNLERSSATL